MNIFASASMLTLGSALMLVAICLPRRSASPG